MQSFTYKFSNFQLQQQLEKISRTNQELQRRNHAVQNQGRELVEEKAEMLLQIQARDQIIEELNLQLGETVRAKLDLEQTKVFFSSFFSSNKTFFFSIFAFLLFCFLHACF